MRRSLSLRESEALLSRWYTKDELEALSQIERVVVLKDVFSTAETILRRRDDEEAGSALAALKITHRIAENESAADAIQYLLKIALEVLGDDRSRESFKMELAGLLNTRPKSGR